MAPNNKPKTDPDKEGEGQPQSVNPNRADPAAPSVPRRAPDSAAAPDASPDRETPKQVSARRVKGARFLAGQWQAADGTPLTDEEAQQAHRAMDEEAAKAREKAQGA